MSAEPGWQAGPRDAITDVKGIRVGHWTDRRGATGCTVIRCETATAAAVDARGGAPGTRETDVLAGANLVRTCHGIVFAGGSAFGLAAATGVMRWFREQGVGFGTKMAKVPIVPAAVIYDLGAGSETAFPGEDAGYAAASRATGGRVAEGSVGAGTGATVAKLLGTDGRIKGGLGTSSLVGPHGIVVGAIAVTNAVGSIHDPDSGALIAGPRDADGRMAALPEVLARRTAQMDALLEPTNTTLVAVATNATLEHHLLQRIAYQAHDGMARVIVPVHTFADGDIAFAISTGSLEVREADTLTVGAMAARAVEVAIVRSVRRAKSLAGIPALG